MLLIPYDQQSPPGTVFGLGPQINAWQASSALQRSDMADAIPWARIFPDADHRWIMGLRAGDPLDTYFARHDLTGSMLAERARWFAEQREQYLAYLPEADAGIRETARLANCWGVPLDDQFADPTCDSLSLLHALGSALEPDLVWMHPDGTGTHRLVGGAVCFPSSWALSDMLGRPMSEVHALVPGLNALLSRQIETFLAKLAPGAPWQRENWSLARDFDLNHHPSRRRPRLDATVTPEEVCLRLEHQLLLKLPHSGSVLFGIRLELVPLTVVLQNQSAASRLARLLATMTAAAAEYKGLGTARPQLLQLLQSNQP